MSSMYREILAGQLQANTIGMIILLVWAVANILVSFVLQKDTKKESIKYYLLQMNIYWNIINVILCVAGFWVLKSIVPANMDLSQTIYTMFSFEKILVFNAGLDIAYVAIGSYLFERGLRLKKPILEGYGKSLWIQGGFLFALDMVLFLVNYYFNAKYSIFILF